MNQKMLHSTFLKKKFHVKICQAVILFCILFISLYTRAQTTETFSVNGVPKIYINLLEPGPITKDSSLKAHMQIINASGSTYTTAQLYDGYIDIKGRGQTSWNKPKKPYSVDLTDANGGDTLAGIFGMPPDNEWALIANYNDKSLLRNSLAYYLGNAIAMEYSPRYRFAEVYLDSSYLGLYILCEKIKRSTYRVNIAKSSTTDLTGGYIIEATTKSRIDSTDSTFKTSKEKELFVIDYPKSKNIIPQQVSYIEQYMNDFEAALFGSNFKDPTTGYAKYIDVKTFVDWYLINELAKNNDANLLASCFFYKDTSGKLKAGPLWDFDIGFGNDINNNNDKEDGFWIQTASYYNRLFQDPAFVQQVQARWAQIRPVLDSMPPLIFTAANQLMQSGAIDRNFQKWPILGINLGSNPAPYPKKYSGEITHLTDWFKQRINWMNIYLQSTAQAQCDSINNTKPVISIIGTDEYDNVQPFEARTLRGFSGYFWNNFQSTSYDTTISTPGKYWLKMSVNGCTTLVSDTLYFGIHLDTPVAIAATQLTQNSFIANWNSVNRATNYQLDVSTTPSFSVTGPPTTVNEGFDNGSTPPTGWLFSKGIAVDTKKFGIASPAIKFNKTGRSVTTATYPAPVTNLSFFIRGITTNSGSLLVEGYDGITWKTIQNITNISKTSVTKTYNSGSSGWQNNFVRFRFTYTLVNAAIDFDDVSVTYTSVTPSYVPGYNHLTVNGTSQMVSGLTANTTYYYRVRAMSSNDSSAYSNIINVTTCSSSSISISNIAITNVSCNGNNSGAIDVTATGGTLTYSWTGPNDFTSTNEDITNLFAGSYNLIITSDAGCGLDTTVLVTEPAALTATTNEDPITCSGGTTTVVVNATGGTGNYLYTLTDGINTQGPQSDNHFTVTAGSYTITVTDGNNCMYDTSITIADGNACGVEFTAGNLVVLQTTGTVSKASSAITLNEFTTNGAAGITVSLPTTGGTPIQTSGVFGGSEGFLTTSTDNKYILLGGYGTSASFIDITATASSAVPRVIGTVSSSGAYQQVASSSNAYSANDIRGAISDGTNYWASGASNANIDGIDYYAPGAFAGLGTDASNPAKAYGLHIFNGQIYYSTQKAGPINSKTQLGVFALGTGLPTTNPVTITQVINTTTSTLEDFSFNPDMSVCYIANNSIDAGAGIQKWTNSGGVWTLAYTLGTGVANVGAYGLVVDYSGANPVVYATTNDATGNRIIKITDAGAGSSATTIVAAQDGIFYKGICFAPVGSESPFANLSSISKTINAGLNIHVFPNPSANQFMLAIQSSSKEKVEIIVADVYGKKVYQASGFGNSQYSFGKELISGIYFVQVIQGKNIKTLKLIKGK